MRALGLPVEVSDGCEADDCIASLAARFAGERPVIIVGADKDLKQCLAPDGYLWDPASREEKLLSLEHCVQESGLTPAQWPDMQALLGDSSDNIPGIPGVGPKTAEKFCRTFRTWRPSVTALTRCLPSCRTNSGRTLRPCFCTGG
jgi:DNA polymerase-1